MELEEEREEEEAEIDGGNDHKKRTEIDDVVWRDCWRVQVYYTLNIT